ncbi:MAG: TonB-dependent siderophore receptor [Pseudomonadota bacterium]
MTATPVRRVELRLNQLALAVLSTLMPAVVLAGVPADAAAELDRVVVSGTRAGAYAPGPTAGPTGLVLSPRETPQSISTVGREQMDDFGLDSINEVLESTTGVNVERVETGRTYYTARGFDITNFQRDGLGVPLPYGIQNGDVDTALYERIEVLRGANGLMSATGNPSATVNFVRKRPTQTWQASARAGIGSWDRLRLDGDVSGPLGASGAVRGRAVAAWERSDSYLDRYSHEKAVGYGVIETDLGATARLTAGLSYQRNDADSPLWGALPLYYSDGTPTDYDRSTSTAADWSFWDTEETRGFLEYARMLGADWKLRAAYNYEKSSEDTELFYVYGTPDRATGEGLYAYPSQYVGGFTAHQFDVRASGVLQLAGRSHDLVIGAGMSRGDMREISWYGDDIGTPLPAPLQHWNGSYPKPVFDAFSDGSDFDYRRDSLYATARWNLADTVKLITGANAARVRTTGVGYGEPAASEETRTSPFLGAVWDIAPAVSLYASYGEIFAQQSKLDIDGRPVGMILGSNAEVGAKGEWLGGRLNASAAVFRVEQENLAEYAGFDPVTARSYYAGRDATSRGIEFDVSGQIGAGWSLSGGFTHLDVEDADGAQARTYVPRNMLRLSSVWTVRAVDGLRLGVSVRWQDDIERTQGARADGTPIVTRQDAYTVVGLMAGYRFADRWDAVLNVDNVTDEKYIPSLYWAQGYYAPPRNVSLSVGYRF